VKSTVSALSLSVAMCSMPCSAWADEPLVGFVYTTDLLPHGEFELAQ